MMTEHSENGLVWMVITKRAQINFAISKEKKYYPGVCGLPACCVNSIQSILPIGNHWKKQIIQQSPPYKYPASEPNLPRIGNHPVQAYQWYADHSFFAARSLPCLSGRSILEIWSCPIPASNSFMVISPIINILSIIGEICNILWENCYCHGIAGKIICLNGNRL